MKWAVVRVQYNDRIEEVDCRQVAPISARLAVFNPQGLHARLKALANRLYGREGVDWRFGTVPGCLVPLYVVHLVDGEPADDLQVRAV